jgi:hypothetical protein
MTTTINGRQFTLTENTAELRNLRADLQTRGFDGTIWEGFSARTGRQRKDLHSLIYRATDGRFITTHPARQLLLSPPGPPPPTTHLPWSPIPGSTASPPCGAASHLCRGLCRWP